MVSRECGASLRDALVQMTREWLWRLSITFGGTVLDAEGAVLGQ